MLKTLKFIEKTDKETYRRPLTVQDIIPIQRVWPDGIFLAGNKYSFSWRFTDINYLVAGEDEKKNILEKYAAFLKSLDNSATTKITVNNHKIRKSDFEQSVLMKLINDGLDVYRQEYNQMLLDKSVNSNGLIQEKYITVTVAKESVEEARSFFHTVGTVMTQHMKEMGSFCEPMSVEDRLRLLHGFYRYGEENSFRFDMQDDMQKGYSFKDCISPEGMEQHADYLVIGNRFARVMYLQNCANYVDDRFLSQITSIDHNLMMSIDMISIPTDEALKEVERKLLSVDTNITNWQQRQNKNMNFSAKVPYDMELQRAAVREYMESITLHDQRMILANMTFVVTADTKEQLERETKEIRSVAEAFASQITVLKYQQIDGLNTVLPMGLRKIQTVRTYLSGTLAAFVPFMVQEISDKGGFYFGENALSHNLILCNKENLVNQSSFLLGIPGSGKSFCAKEMIAFLILNTSDDIIIVDPEGEYSALVEAMGNEGSVVRIAAGGADRLNVMNMVDGYGDNDSIVMKSEFVMSLLEQIDKECTGPVHRSVVDRCVRRLYRNNSCEEPTLTLLRKLLMEQSEPEARRVAQSLELYTTGSLNNFGKETNVDLDKRVLVFDIHRLGQQLKPIGLLVTTDCILNRTTMNWQKGKRTHVFVDEFHVVFENPYSAQFFCSAWKQFRKRNVYPTAITQNCEYLRNSVEARTMLSNSEFIVLLSQGSGDIEILSPLLNISPEQISYVKNAKPGSGLLRYGSTLIPFENSLPKNTKLYGLMTTKPGEGVFSGRQQ